MDKGAQNYNLFLKGDKNAFEQIVNLYANGLVLFVLGYVRNESTAEDIMEDTFVKLLSKRVPFTPKAQFKTYLFTIAKNLSLNYLRSQKRKKTVNIEQVAEIPDSIDSNYFENDDKRKLYEALARLNNDYRQILYLTYFEELSNAQAGNVMGKSKKQISNLLYNAKQTLRNTLEKDGYKYEE